MNNTEKEIIKRLQNLKNINIDDIKMLTRLGSERIHKWINDENFQEKILENFRTGDDLQKSFYFLIQDLKTCLNEIDSEIETMTLEDFESKWYYLDQLMHYVTKSVELINAKIHLDQLTKQLNGV